MNNIVHVGDVYDALNSLSNILQNMDNERFNILFSFKLMQKISLMENILNGLSECL